MKSKLITVLFLSALIPIIAFAHGYGWNQSWRGGHMGIMGGGWMMIIWIIVIVFLIATAVKWMSGRSGSPAATSSALSILAERYAKGEITREQYEEMKNVL